MAKLKGNEVALSVNTGTVLLPVWKVIACITVNGLESTTDELDGSSKCGIDIEPGDITWSASIEGWYELSPESDQVSGAVMIGYNNDKVYRDYKMSNADSSYYRGFNAAVANYKEQADYKTIVSFSNDFLIKGTLILTDPDA